MSIYDRRTAAFSDDETEARVQLHQWLGQLEKLVESARADVRKPDGPHFGSGNAPVADLVGFLRGLRHEEWHNFYFG
jgi:hypothetical protein